MAEFKVGDEVKVVGVDMESMDRPYVGKTGMVVRISYYPFPYHVEFDDGYEHCFNPKCLRKIDAGNFKVGDVVKIVRPDNATDNQFVGKVGEVIKIVERMSYPVLVDTDGVERWYSFKALEKNSISEYHSFHVGDVVAVKGSGFVGKIAEFSNANRPSGITVVVMNDRGEKRGITTTDIEKAIVKRVFNVGDWVKITERAPKAPFTTSVYIGKVDKVSEVTFSFGEWTYKVGLYFYPAHSLIATQAPKEIKPESTRLKVGDRVRVVKDAYDNRFVGKTGKITIDDGSGVPFVVQFDGDPDSERWFLAYELVKIEDVKQVENKIKVGDMVKVIGKDNEADSQFVGRVGKVTQIDDVFKYSVGINFDGYGFRRFSEKCLEVVAEKQHEEKKFKVGDKVRIIIDVPSIYKKVGVIAEDDGSSDRPLNVKDEHGNHIFWCEPEWLEKVSEVKPQEVEKQEERKLKLGDTVKIVAQDTSMDRLYLGRVGTIKKDDGFPYKFLVTFQNHSDRWFSEKCLEKVEEEKPVNDWRARFEAFKASHPVGTKVKIAKKAVDEKSCMWVGSMDATVGKTGEIAVLEIGPDYYKIGVKFNNGVIWHYGIAALEDMTEESNQYTFTVKSSDVDLDRIWREANADFAVVVDYDKRAEFVWLLYRSMGGFQRMSVQREIVHDEIKRRKTAYENEKKQRVTVTIY